MFDAETSEGRGGRQKSQISVFGRCGPAFEPRHETILAAGVLFCELRVRSDSLLAPVLAHWAVNGLGVIFVQMT